MPQIPDWFDLWVKKTRERVERYPERGSDFLLGAMIHLKEFYFWSQSEKLVQPAVVELDQQQCLLVFSHLSKLEDMLERSKGFSDEEGIKKVFIAMPPVQAIEYSLSLRSWGIEGILVNPGEYAFFLSFQVIEAFYKQWKKRDLQEAQPFWIPQMTTEEEDFWAEHGIE